MAEREQTRPFPEGKARSQWVERERRAPAVVNGMVEFEYEVLEDDTVDMPFFIVNHRAQLREDHQRITIGPNGGLMHVDAGEVLDPADFLANDNGAYLFDPSDGLWHRRRGNQTLSPFLWPRAPWAGGGDEGLDPQWVRETFTLPIADQVADAKRRRLDRAEAKQESGDKRGTTLNLQVGANADDAYDYNEGGNTDDTNIIFNFGDSNPLLGGARFTSVTIPQGATIDTAIFTIAVEEGENDNPELDIHADDVDDSGVIVGGTSLHDRTITTASVRWSDTDIAALGSGFFDSPEIKTVIQEVVDRGGWSSGNALSILGVDATTSKSLWALAHNQASINAPQLDIDYTAGGAGPAVPVFYRHYRRMKEA